MAKIAVHGFVNTDLIGLVDAFAELDQEMELKNLQILPGGSAANVAVGLSRLGEEVYFLGAVGQRSYASFLLESFENVRLDYVQTIADAPSGMVMALVDPKGLRTLYTYPGANEHYDLSLVPDQFWREIDYVHLSSPRLELAHQLLLSKETNPGLRVSFDPSSLLTKKGISCLQPLLMKTDILFVNQSELFDLFPHGKMEEALQSLHALGVKDVFIKQGAEGAMYSSISEGTHEVLSLPAEKVMERDSTGSGDAFTVGVLYGLARGWSRKKIVQAGIHLGGLVVSQIGARTGLPFLLDKKE